MESGELLTLLLGGGVSATIIALFNGIKAMREGSHSRERDTVADLIDRRKEADADRDKAYELRDQALDERDYWRRIAGDQEYAMRIAGVKIPDRPNFEERE